MFSFSRKMYETEKDITQKTCWPCLLFFTSCIQQLPLLKMEEGNDLKNGMEWYQRTLYFTAKESK